MSLTVTTDPAFAADVLVRATPVLVDFTAEGCASCTMVTPILEQLAAEQSGRLSVLAIDVDENPITADHYDVRATPTLALFVGGREVTRIVGVKPGELIMRELEPHLPSAG
jgi:thioredoxin 1